MVMIAAVCYDKEREKVAQDRQRQKEETACTLLYFSLPALFHLVSLLLPRQLTDTDSHIPQCCSSDLTNKKSKMRARTVGRQKCLEGGTIISFRLQAPFTSFVI